ncbi:restriction endonuclease [Rhodococcus erythropolis]|uniref:restriction endonuclease n=1 Tax=Rhodococcus erythropolis TaxID=1833 RepID=UPI0030135E81
MQYIQTPHDAELNAAEAMKAWGFGDAVATTGGADGGIDVRSKRALAQVKWKGGVTGRPDIQNLYGARGMGDELLFFFSASGYSDQAVVYADQVGISLFTYDPIGAVEAANKVARDFLAMSATSVRVANPLDVTFILQLSISLVVISATAALLFLFA